MSAEEKIDSYIDLKATGKETSEMLAQINSIWDAFKKVKGTKISISGSETLKGVADGVKKVKQEQDELQKITNRLITSYEKRQALDSENAKNLALETERLRERNAQVKDEAKLQNATANSIDFARAKVAQLRKERNALDLESEKGIARQKELNAEIDKYDEFIKANVDTYTKQKINIGNYSGALKILEGQLESVRKQLEQTKKSQQTFSLSPGQPGPGRPGSGSSVRPAAVGDPQAIKLYNDQLKQTTEEVERLNKEEALLSRIVESQINGFASASAELKSNEKALQALAAAGLTNNEFYDKLLKQTAELKDNVGDLKAEIKNLASDTRTLDGLIAGANLLAGAYGLAVAGAELFGKENEELAQAMRKLEAIQTILLSLQSIQNALQKESGLMLLINNARQKIAIAQTYLQTVAEGKLTVAKYAAIAAQKTLNFLFSSMGGPILLAVAAITGLAAAIYKLTQDTEDSLETFKEWNAEIENSKRLLDDRLDIIKSNGDIELSIMKRNFESDAKLRRQGIKNLYEQYQAVQDTERLRRAQYEKSKKFIEDTFATTDISALSDNQKEALKEADSFVKSYEAINKRISDLNTQIVVAENDNQRALVEESISQRQKDIDNLKITEQDRINILNDTVSDERKTYAQRIAAAKEAQRIQEQIANQDAARARLDPNLKNDPAGLANVEKVRRSTIVNSRRETEKQIEALEKEAADRLRKATYDRARNEIEANKAINEEIAQDNERSLEERLDSAYSASKSAEALVIGERSFQLASENLTAEERTAIEEKADADILAIRRAFLKSAEQLSREALDDQNADALSRSNIERDQAITALNERFAAGKISYQQYQRELLDLEKQYTKESLQIQIDSVAAVIKLFKEQGRDTTQEEEKLADLQKRLSDEVTNKKIDNLNKLKDKERELRDAITEFAVTLVSSTFDRENNAIQERMDLLDEEEEKQKEKVESEALSEEDKSKKIAAIEASTQRQREALEQRQRQNDERKARFDRLVSVGRIIASTAEAIIKAVAESPLTGGQPFAAIAAALGAIQLATVLATPLPRYKGGRDGGPAEWAITGDGGRQEVVASPDLSSAFLTPARDTITYLPEDWKVYKDMDTYRSVLHKRNFGTLGTIPSTDNSYAIAEAVGREVAKMTSAITNMPSRGLVVSKGQIMEMIKVAMNEYLIVNPR